jgi:hypothetical protein
VHLLFPCAFTTHTHTHTHTQAHTTLSLYNNHIIPHSHLKPSSPSATMPNCPFFRFLSLCPQRILPSNLRPKPRHGWRNSRTRECGPHLAGLPWCRHPSYMQADRLRGKRCLRSEAQTDGRHGLSSLVWKIQGPNGMFYFVR